MCALASRAKNKLAAWKEACAEKDDEIKKWFDDITEYEDVVVDEEKLSNLLKRTKVYGDVAQGETEETFRIMLQKTGNDVPTLMEYLTAKHRSTQMFQPPTIYKDDDVPYVPPAFQIKK